MGAHTKSIRYSSHKKAVKMEEMPKRPHPSMLNLCFSMVSEEHNFQCNYHEFPMSQWTVQDMLMPMSLIKSNGLHKKIREYRIGSCWSSVVPLTTSLLSMRHNCQITWVSSCLTTHLLSLNVTRLKRTSKGKSGSLTQSRKKKKSYHKIKTGGNIRRDKLRPSMKKIKTSWRGLKRCLNEK